MNTKFLKADLRDITVELLDEAIAYAYAEGIYSHDSLGRIADGFLLYGEPCRSEISIRLCDRNIKLMVTDKIGSYLFYGGFDTSILPISFIAQQYFDTILNVMHLLENTAMSLSLTESDKEDMFNRRIVK